MTHINTYRINGFFIFLFICLIGSQIFLAQRPEEIGLPIYFHVSTVGMFLIYALITFLMRSSPIKLDRLMLVTALFLAYFYTVGVAISSFNRVEFVHSIEFPYRICNLFLIFVFPMFVQREDDLSKFMVMVMVMVALVTLTDMAFWLISGNTNKITAMRMVGAEFSSSHISLVPLAFGGLIAFWNVKTHRILIRFLLLLFWALVIGKIFLSFSRIIWLLFPVNIVAVSFLLWRKGKVSPEFRQWGMRIVRVIVWLALLSIIGVLIIAIYNPQVSDFIALREQLTGREMNNRLSEYGNAFREWLSSPIWGHGFGYQALLYKGNSWRQQDYVHNFVLQFLQSGGLIGLGLILSLLGVTFFRSMKMLNRSRSLLQSAALIAGIMLIFNVGMAGLVYTLLLKQETYLFIALAISIGIVVERLQHQKGRWLIIRVNRNILPDVEEIPMKAALNPKR